MSKVKQLISYAVHDPWFYVITIGGTIFMYTLHKTMEVI